MTVIARYGDAEATLGIHNETLAVQLAHRSVRKFTPEPVTDEQLSAIVAAAQSAATSSNLQPWSVIAVRDRKHKARLAELGLPPHTVATFGLAVGHPDPTENAGIKPRLPRDAVLHRERYDAQTADAYIPGYDERLAAYNSRYGLPGNWSQRVLARLAGPQSLSGRHRLREQLKRLGLPSR